MGSLSILMPLYSELQLVCRRGSRGEGNQGQEGQGCYELRVAQHR